MFTNVYGVSYSEYHFSLFDMKRAELAKLSGYSGRHISMLAPSLPGATQTEGGQWLFDRHDPRLQQWIRSAQANNAAKAERRAAHARKPPRRAFSARIEDDLDAMEDFVRTFNQCHAIFSKVTLTPLGLQIPAQLAKPQWNLLLEFWHSLGRMPTEESLLLIHDYTSSNRLPPSAEAFYGACSEFVGEMGLSDKVASRASFARIGFCRRHASAVYLPGLADLLSYAKSHFEIDDVHTALEDLLFSFIDVKKAAVISLLPVALRHSDLTAEHYWIVGQCNFALQTREDESPLMIPCPIGIEDSFETAFLPSELQPGNLTERDRDYAKKCARLDTAKKSEWLRTARVEKLSPLELKRSIETGKLFRDPGYAARKTGGIVSVQAVGSLFEFWKRKNGASVVNGTKKKQIEFLCAVAPIIDFVESIWEQLAQTDPSFPPHRGTLNEETLERMADPERAFEYFKELMETISADESASSTET